MNDKDIQRSEEIELDIGKILKALLRDALLIVVSAAVGTAAAFLFALLLTPKYESAAMFYVQNNASLSGSGGISSADIAASKELVASYIVILQSEETLEAVINYAAANRTSQEVMEMIEASAVNSTEFFKVTVTSADAQEAERLANAISYVLPARVQRIMPGASATIVDAAVVTSQPCSPEYETITLIGFLAGLCLSAGAVVVRTVLDKTICTKRDITKHCAYPILATVPETDPGESCRLLRTKLLLSLPENEGARIIGITGAMEGEGKSLLAMHLTRSLKKRGKKALLLDCDPRRSCLAERLNQSAAPGLTDFLTGRCGPDRILRCCGGEQAEPRIHVILPGEAADNAPELLASQRMTALLKALRKRCDYVILDLPPVGESGEVLELARETDGMVLTVRQNVCNAAALGNAIEQLEFAEAKILGVVFCTETK